MHKYIVKAEVETDRLIDNKFRFRNVKHGIYVLYVNVSGYTKEDACNIARSFCELFVPYNNHDLVKITYVRAKRDDCDIMFDYFVGRCSYKCYVDFESIEKN